MHFCFGRTNFLVGVFHHYCFDPSLFLECVFFCWSLSCWTSQWIDLFSTVMVCSIEVDHLRIKHAISRQLMFRWSDINSHWRSADLSRSQLCWRSLVGPLRLIGKNDSVVHWKTSACSCMCLWWCPEKDVLFVLFFPATCNVCNDILIQVQHVEIVARGGPIGCKLRSQPFGWQYLQIQIRAMQCGDAEWKFGVQTRTNMCFTNFYMYMYFTICIIVYILYI